MLKNSRFVKQPFDEGKNVGKLNADKEAEQHSSSRSDTARIMVRIAATAPHNSGKQDAKTCQKPENDMHMRADTIRQSSMYSSSPV